MTLKTYVGFVADFPTDRDDHDDAPAGIELADFVFTQLQNAGVDVQGPEEREAWGWNVTANIDRTRVYTVVGLVDDMEAIPPRQWLITNDAPMSMWKRLFGSRAFQNQCELALRRYCETLHKILATDHRFSQIMWYSKDTFDKPGDQPGPSP